MIIDDLLLEKCIGKGAFGEVYLTSKKGDESKKFATKKWEREEIDGQEALKFYLTNEINILKILNHPNIVKFDSIKKTKKHYFIVIEYCNGGELSKILEKYKERYGHPFTQEIVQHFMRQIIGAFNYMHEKKITHKDINLENILINFESEKDKEDLNLMKANVKIIGFGFSTYGSPTIAKVDAIQNKKITLHPIAFEKLKSSGQKKVTLDHEQKDDIWSLGNICYEMIIGRPAFDGENKEEIIKKIQEGAYTVPTNLSKELISFIYGMLIFDPSYRLSSKQLLKHPFITNEIKEFHLIDLKQIEEEIVNNELKININKIKTIWYNFNFDNEEKLVNVDSKKQEENKPILPSQ